MVHTKFRPTTVPPNLRTTILRGTILIRQPTRRASTVADALRMVGQKYVQLGTRDFLLDKFTGQLDIRLQRHLRAFEKQEPAPTRVKPAPLQLVHHVFTTAHQSHHNHRHDMYSLLFSASARRIYMHNKQHPLPASRRPILQRTTSTPPPRGLTN
jgi:hypothetical protein